MVNIEVKADWRIELRVLISSSEDEDDPILSDPSPPSTKALYDAGTLGAIDFITWSCREKKEV